MPLFTFSLGIRAAACLGVVKGGGVPCWHEMGEFVENLLLLQQFAFLTLQSCRRPPRLWGHGLQRSAEILDPFRRVLVGLWFFFFLIIILNQ